MLAIEYLAAEEHPVSTAVGWLFGSTFGLVVLAVAGLALLALFCAPVRVVLGPLWRFATGGPIFWQRGPWESRFLYPAPPRSVDRAAFRGEHYPRTRWGYMPGYQRMLVRWSVIGYGWTLYRLPWPTMAATGAVVLVLAVRQVVRLIERRGLVNAAGLFIAGVAPLLGYVGRDPATWVAMPRARLVWTPVAVHPRLLQLARRVSERLEHALARLAVPMLRVPLEADDARVRIALEPDEIRRDAIEAVKALAVSRLENGPWEATHHDRDLSIELRHPKRPPSTVWYTAEANQRFAVDDVPIGQRAGGEWVTLPLRKLTPHGICSASTGWCKTTTANVWVAHTAGNGGRVFIKDPKRIGYLEAFRDLPNVTIRTTVEGWAATVAEFHAEMERRYQIIERFPEIAEDPALYFQPWFMITDERGSYVSEINNWWKQVGQKGVPAPPLRLEKLVLWQARAAGMYVFDLAQQANLAVFIDSDGRDQRMYRIASGPQTRSSWVMLFPGVPKVALPMKKGRAILGLGPDNIEELQLAQVSPADARAFAQAGAAIAEKENAERERRLRELTGESVLPSGSVVLPGQTPTSVPGQGGNGHAPYSSGETAPAAVTAVAEIAPEIAPEMVGESSASQAENGLIVGLQAAADFLGMSRDGFEKARQRAITQGRPIEGEVRRGTQPAWSPLALREWRAQAPRAGRRWGKRNDQGE